ncbi:hypothetical protein L6452_18022 [Arctium lappa]|uniref:Uncharacterized protein n=1 Tax=Arctium lappa TaxID=4217 RepID=A0ACB9C506_ARCLA|nr:hypothetical protein L6452_18022 [Arctium lappa]
MASRRLLSSLLRSSLHRSHLDHRLLTPVISMKTLVKGNEIDLEELEGREDKSRILKRKDEETKKKCGEDRPAVGKGDSRRKSGGD